MIETLHEVLTDAAARETKVVQAKLEESSSSSTPWFN